MHTPGPWEHNKQPSEPWCIWGLNGTRAIAALCHNDDPAITTANARLIAAAPELLAACKAALATFPANAGCGLTTTLSYAIAKAEGRTS